MQNSKEQAIIYNDEYSDFSFFYLHGWVNRTPEFMMYIYKVKKCERSVCLYPAKPCPFVHQGHEVGRRDLLWHRYNCFPCLDFKKGFCPRANSCAYAHGIMEERFHPMLFRTRYCWYMNSCNREDCSYAHAEDEKRLPTFAPYMSNTTCRTSFAFPNNNITNSPSTTKYLWQNQTSLFAADYFSFSQVPPAPSFINPLGEEYQREFDAENGLYGKSCSSLMTSQFSMNNLQCGFNQPDFSWVHVLVEDDHQPAASGLVSNEDEEIIMTKPKVEYSCVEQK